MDPPHVVHEPTFANTATQQFDSTAKYGDGAAPEETPRAWWHAKEADGWKHYEGVREALTSIREALETQGPFDGVFGFSQGAAMAAIVAAVLAHPERVDESKLGSVPKHPKLKFAVCVAGFLPLDPQLQSLFKEPVDSTSLQVRFSACSQSRKRVLTSDIRCLGEATRSWEKVRAGLAQIYGHISERCPQCHTDRSLPLVKAFKNPRVEWHDGGTYLSPLTHSAVNRAWSNRRSVQVTSRLPRPPGATSSETTWLHSRTVARGQTVYLRQARSRTRVRRRRLPAL